MLWSNKKGEEGSSWGLIFAIVLGMVFLVMIIGIILVQKGDFLTKETALQTGCWLTNSIKCTGGIFSKMPSLCSPLETLEEPVDMPKLADLTRDTWWMYKESTCDFGVVADEVYPVYAFNTKDNIFIGDYFKYLLEHNKGQEVKEKIENSDYAYLETNTEEQTICFDKSDYNGQDSSTLVLESDNGPYYILYYDDQGPENDGGDKILITRNPNFDAGYWKTIGLRTGALAISAGALAAIPVAAAGSATILTLKAGFSIWTALNTGVLLGTSAISVSGGTIAIIGLGGMGLTSATFYLTADSDESECLVYSLTGGSPNEE